MYKNGSHAYGSRWSSCQFILSYIKLTLLFTNSVSSLPVSMP